MSKKKKYISSDIKSKLISALLSVSMISSAFTGLGSAGGAVVSMPVNAVTAEDYGLTDSCQEGVILHAWQWSFNNIKDNMEQIAQAGYTSIQTSVIQQCKESTLNKTNEYWWLYYQPANFTIDNTGYSALGTKAEFTAMCEEAHKYGIHVIVDVVSNHLGNQTGYDITTSAPSDIKDDTDCWHDTWNIKMTNSSNRNQSINYSLDGLPDLNTENPKIQAYVLDYLKECIDAGADGFRFDTAKHIGTLADGEQYTYWHNVIPPAKEYYANSENTAFDSLYCYGEFLGSTGDSNNTVIINSLLENINLTDDVTGNNIRSAVVNKNATSVKSNMNSYNKADATANQLVLWAESHDTYSNEEQQSTNVSDSDINKTWALVASRSDATALYFARTDGYRGGYIGEIGSTECFSNEVVAVNQFHNAFNGQSEYISQSGNIVYNERGKKGVVLVNVGGNSASVSVTAKRMLDGVYTDQITGNTFTVVNGTISGTIGSTGIAVVYNPDDVSEPVITNSKLYLVPSSKWTSGNARFAMYFFNSADDTAWVNMSDSDGDGIYEGDVPQDAQWNNVIFCRMDGSATENTWSNKVYQTEDLFPDSNTNCYTVIDSTTSTKDGGTWSDYSVCEHTYGEPVWTWNGTSSAFATFTCTQCGSAKNVTATITKSIGDTTVTYTATVTFNGNTYTSEKTVEKEETTAIYLVPNSNWTQANARFAVYVWAGSVNTWVDLTAYDSSTYIAELPADTDWTNAIFCRMNPATTENKWGNKWNQTKDLSLSSDKNCYTMADDGTWDTDNDGTWSYLCTSHEYNAPVWSWNGTSSATASFTCGKCGDIQTVQAVITSSTTPAACTENGSTVYTATAVFDGQTYTDTKTVSINATGHHYGEPVWTWNGTSSATADFTCGNCGDVQTVQAAITSSTTPATCTENGSTVYTATAVFDGQTYTDTKTVSVNATGHHYGEPVWNWNGTSSATATFTCGNCSDVQTVQANITSASANGVTTYTAVVTFNGDEYTNSVSVSDVPEEFDEEAFLAKCEAYKRLSNENKEIYRQLLTFARSVVNGDETSSTYSFVYEDFPLEWTDEELGLSSGAGEEEMLEGLGEKFFGIFDINTVIDALLADCPYEFYWFNKTKGYEFGLYPYGYYCSSGSTSTISLTDSPEYYITMEVSANYQDDTTDSFDVSKINAVKNSVPAAARAIVNKYAGVSDYEKIKGYSNELCKLVEYNYDAANGNVADYDLDPWQLVYVFDDDESTNVVCEGYSKAFKYLCSLTDFNSSLVKCYLVTGTLSDNQTSGKHMWNIVTMNDGKNYLVDVTDSDAMGRNYHSFLLNGGTLNGSFYRVRNRSNSSDALYFAYDNDTNALWSTDILTLSGTDYSEVFNITINDTENGTVTADVQTAVQGETVTLTVSADEGYETEKVMYNNTEIEAVSGVYSFEMPAEDVEISVVFVLSEEKTIPVNFVDINGKIKTTLEISAINGSFADVSEELNNIPSAPYLDGYEFAGWSVGDNTYDSDGLKAVLVQLISQEPESITVNEVYNQKETLYTVNVIGGTLADGSTSGQFKASEQLFITAGLASEGQKFSHWEKDGVIVGYEETYAFRMPSTDETTFTAKYVTEETDVDKVGTAYIESVTKTGENKISFVSVVSVPDGSKILRAGVVANTEANLGSNELTIDNTLFESYNSTTCRSYTTFKYTFTKKNVQADDIWCVRAYLRYTDEAGNTTDVYGDMVKANSEGAIV